MTEDKEQLESQPTASSPSPRSSPIKGEEDNDGFYNDVEDTYVERGIYFWVLGIALIFFVIGYFIQMAAVPIACKCDSGSDAHNRSLLITQVINAVVLIRFVIAFVKAERGFWWICYFGLQILSAVVIYVRFGHWH